MKKINSNGRITPITDADKARFLNCPELRYFVISVPQNFQRKVQARETVEVLSVPAKVCVSR